MSIKPIQTVKDFVQNNVNIRKNAARAVDNLYEFYGDKINYHSVYKNKNGVVCALGFKSKNAPYSFSYTIFPNGDEMQKIADYKFTSDGLKRHYLSFLKTTEGECKLVSTAVNDGLRAQSESVNFLLSKKEPQVVDLMQHLRTLPMPKR